MLAIQAVTNGHLIDYCETKEQAQWFLDQPEKFELIDVEHSSKIEVIYTELGGPSGYGHQESSFTTHGGLLRCVRNLIKWMQDSARIFGPDARDIRDFFQHCNLYVNGEDKSSWLWKQLESLSIKTIYA